MDSIWAIIKLREIYNKFTSNLYKSIDNNEELKKCTLNIF
jgi:hypothetical protein